MLRAGIERLSRRYARALLDLAREQGVADVIFEQLRLLGQLAREVPEFRAFLRSPVIPARDKAVILRRLLTGKVHELLLAFLDLLARKNRIIYLAIMAQEYERLYYEWKGIVPVEVTTAVQISDATYDALKRELKQQLQKEVLIRPAVDETLIGGFALSFEDYLLDMSIRRQLQTYRQKVLDSRP